MIHIYYLSKPCFKKKYLYFQYLLRFIEAPLTVCLKLNIINRLIHEFFIYLLIFSVLDSTILCWFFSRSTLSWWPHYISSSVMRNCIGKKVVLWTSVFSITCWVMDWPIFISTIGSEWIHYWLKIKNHCNMWLLWFAKLASI